VKVNAQISDGVEQKTGRSVRKMVDSQVEGLIAINNEGKVTEINEAQLRMRGAKSREDVVGKHVSCFFAGKDRDRIAYNIARALAEKQNVAKSPYTFVTVDGAEFPGELSVVVVFSASGEMVGFLGFVKQM
jgi:PAS domain S-box-containing protein